MKACLLLFFYFSLIGQLHGANVKIKENESVMGSTAMTYDLSEEKLMKLKYKSQHGDSEASFRLYQYYCFTKNNIDKQLRFLERSASQGNVTAQFNYGVFLSDTNPTLSEYYNLNRAIYWMEFAVNNGNIDTKSKLQELSEWIEGRIRRIRKSNSSSDCRSSSMMMNQGCTITIIGNINRSRGGITLRLRLGWKVGGIFISIR